MRQDNAKETETSLFTLVNQPVVVPVFNVTVEDVFIAFGISVGLATLAVLLVILGSFIWPALNCLSISTLFLAFTLSVSLIIFCRKKRNEELALKGVSRTSILKRYAAYLMGSDVLRGR